MKFVDAHVHLADPRYLQSSSPQQVLLSKDLLTTVHLSTVHLTTVLGRAQAQGIGYFLQGGIDPQDWQRQLQLSQDYPGQIGLCFGLHPYFVAQHSLTDCELALDQLSRLLPQAVALGELGLDFRSQFSDSIDRQWAIFEAQMELASVAQKPMVFHLVRCFAEIKEYFRWSAPLSQSGMIHSFNGPPEHLHFYLEKGFYISIGGAATWPQNQKLHRSLLELPLNRLLIESDAPDQSPHWDSFSPASPTLNEPLCVVEVAHRIAEIRQIRVEEVLQIAADNLNHFLGGVINS